MVLIKAVISLVVVGLVATAFAATEGQESLTFAEWSANAAGFNPAGSYYKKSADVKHLCLKENQQYGCRYVGCAGAVTCASNNATGLNVPCPTCFTHVAGLSDVECCNDQDYYPKETAEGSTTRTSSSTVGKVGTCDWDADLFTAEPCTPGPEGEPCGWIPLENGAYQIGTAWATCYLNAGSEECGHPFCDRMVLSFQGGLYFTRAYAKNVSTPLEGVEYDNSGYFGNSSQDGCFVPPPTSQEQLNSGPSPRTGATDAKGAGKKHKTTLNHSFFQKLLAKHPGAAKHAGKSTGKKTTQKRGSTTDPSPTLTGHEYYNGIAFMFSGAVTVTSLDKHVEYSHGLMEYVPFFVATGDGIGRAVPIVGKPSATALVVKPNTYNIQLVAGPKGEGYGSKGAEEYKGDAGKGYYKGGEGQGY